MKITMNFHIQKKNPFYACFGEEKLRELKNRKKTPYCPDQFQEAIVCLLEAASPCMHQ